jgi:hypothetical protein
MNAPIKRAVSISSRAPAAARWIRGLVAPVRRFQRIPLGARKVGHISATASSVLIRDISTG